MYFKSIILYICRNLKKYAMKATENNNAPKNTESKKAIRKQNRENPNTGELISKEQGTEELIKKYYEVLNLMVSEGIGIMKAIKIIKGITIQTFYNIVNFNAHFLQQYTRAQELRAEIMNEKLMKRLTNDKNDTYTNDKGIQAPNPVRVQRDRLIYDATRYQLERMNPKKYGNSTTLKGDADNPLQVIQIKGMIIE